MNQETKCWQSFQSAIGFDSFARINFTKVEKTPGKQDFKPGEIVKLISGGPEMTVRGPHFDVLANRYDPDMLDCVWFELNNSGKQEVHYCPFYAHELAKPQTTNA